MLILFASILCFSFLHFPSSAQELLSTTNSPSPAAIAYEKANWTIATPTGDLRETQYYPAYYTDFAPCPCDLLARQCDSFCCCDSFCGSLTKEVTFNSCAPSTTEGKDKSATGVLAQFGEHLRQLLKQHSVMTPYLGHFYLEVPTTLRTATGYTDFTAKSVDPKAVTFGAQDFSQWETLIAQYPTNKAGSVVRSPEVFEALPSPSLLGDGCTFRSPIRFLENSNVTCVKMVTNRTCIEDFTLNPIAYSPSTVALGLPPVPPLPFDNSTLDQSMTEPQFGIGTQSVHFCKSTVRPWDTRNPSDCQLVTTQISAPTLQNGSRICAGVVVAVIYRFQWSGRMIVNTSEIYLRDVPWGSGVDQYFSVSWIHRASDSANSTTLDKTRTWPGYVWDDVIYGISTVSNETAALSDVSAVRPIQILKSIDATNSCPLSFDPSFSDLEPLRFGPNLDSGCYLNIDKNKFLDCDSLRQEISANWKTLYGGINFLPKYTFESVPKNEDQQPSFQIGDVVHLLRQSPDHPQSNIVSLTTPSPQSGQLSDSTGADQNLTQKLLDEYQKFLDDRGKRQQTVTTAEVQSRDVARSLLPFACGQIPAVARLEIMYAETGFVNGSYLNAIVGAMLRFQYANWRFSDRLNPNQTVFLKTSIRFIRVPAVEPPPVKRYYLTERRDHCPSEITCWNELFYPFLDWFPVEMYRYTQGVGLTMIIGIMGVYIVTRPW